MLLLYSPHRDTKCLSVVLVKSRLRFHISNPTVVVLQEEVSYRLHREQGLAGAAVTDYVNHPAQRPSTSQYTIKDSAPAGDELIIFILGREVDTAILFGRTVY